MNDIISFFKKNNFAITKRKLSCILFAYLTRDLFFVFTLNELYDKLNSSLLERKILRLKIGVDPTGKMHLGHATTFKRIIDFLHYIPNSCLDVVIGDTTILFSSPERKKQKFSKQEIDSNCDNLIRDISFILKDYSNRVAFHKNSIWFSTLSVMDFLPVLELLNVQEILKKFNVNNLSLASAVYPALQAYDSVKLQSDIEFGGSDQLCSVLIAREATGQIAYLTNLLSSKDGKMSKSSPKQAIFIFDEPKVMLKKLLALTDKMFLIYLKYLNINIEFTDLNDLINKKCILAKLIIEQNCSNKLTVLDQVNEEIVYFDKPEKMINFLSNKLQISKTEMRKNWPKITLNNDKELIQNPNFVISNCVIIKLIWKTFRIIF